MHDPEHDAAALKRAAAAAVRSCGEALSWQFEAWPADAGDCAGVVLGPGRHLLDAPAFETSLREVGGLRCGVVAFETAQAVVLVEVIGPEAVAGIYDGGGAALARALREPTGPGEHMVVVLLEEGDAVVPVTPMTARGGGRGPIDPAHLCRCVVAVLGQLGAANVADRSSARGRIGVA